MLSFLLLLYLVTPEKSIDHLLCVRLDTKCYEYSCEEQVHGLKGDKSNVGRGAGNEQLNYNTIR